MKIDDLIEKLQTAKKTWKGNLDIYLEINYDEDCPTCGESESHIIDGFPIRTEVMSIDSIATFAIVATRDAERVP